MPHTVSKVSRAAFDFVDEIERMTDRSLLMARFGRQLADYGFHAWLVTGLPNPGSRIDPLMLLNGWPKGWTELYTKADFVQDDPVVAHCFRSTVPFEWREAPFDPLTNRKAKAVMDRATDFHMRQGFCVPIYSADRFQSVVTMAGDKVDLEAPVKRALHLMAIYMQDKAVALSAPTVPPPLKVLTYREREVLQWTAAGKTSWEISQILHLSEATVTGHIKAACVKFAAPNRLAAVVRALRRGEISL